MASLGRAAHGWARQRSAGSGAPWQGRAGHGPVTAVGRGRVPRPSAAPGQPIPGGAGLGDVWQGGARRGEVWRVSACSGQAWLGPVTAVACGLVPQASAAPRQQLTHLGEAGLGTARQGLVGQRRDRVWLGWATGLTVFGEVRLLTARLSRWGKARLGTAWLGKAGRGEARDHFGAFNAEMRCNSPAPTAHGAAWQAKAMPGRAGRCVAWDSSGRSATTWGSRPQRPRTARPATARRGQDWLGGSGRGWTWLGRADGLRRGSTPHRPRFSAWLGSPRHGQARQGTEVHRVAWLGFNRAAGRHHGSSPWRPRTIRQGQAVLGLEGLGPHWCGTSWRAMAGSGQAGIYNHREAQ